jgi:hypothetical protein
MREAGCVFFAATVWMTRQFLGKTGPIGPELKQRRLFPPQIAAPPSPAYDALARIELVLDG